MLGRKTFYVGELRCLITAENVVIAYQQRSKAESWAAWTENNPSLAAILFEAERIVQDE